MNKIKYKVLKADQTSPYQDFRYKRRRWYHEPNIGKVGDNDCHVGLYATDVEGLLYRGVWRADEAVFRCRVKGRVSGEVPMKTCYEYLQVLERVSDDEIKVLAREATPRLGYKLDEALYPIDPRLVVRTQPAPTDAEIATFKEYIRVWDSVGASVWDSVRASVESSVRASAWASVRDLVRASAWASVRDLVGDSVWASVEDSVWASVRASVRDSVWAYIGSLFPHIDQWYLDHDPGVYPFQAGADLWRAGLVPHYDGMIWRMHSGLDRAVVYEGKK